MPDILSNYSARAGEIVKLFPAKIDDSGPEAIRSLSDGVKKHYIVDGYFHESGYFKTNTSMISDHFRSLPYSTFKKRLYAISHVFLEIMLDRAILVEQKPVCDYLYQLLDNVDMKMIERLIGKNTNAKNPVSVAGHFERFRGLKFIYDYLDDVRFASMIENLAIRMGNPSMSSADKTLFRTTIYDIQKAIISQKFPKFPSDT